MEVLLHTVYPKESLQTSFMAIADLIVAQRHNDFATKKAFVKSFTSLIKEIREVPNIKTYAVQLNIVFQAIGYYGVDEVSGEKRYHKLEAPLLPFLASSFNRRMMRETGEDIWNAFKQYENHLTNKGENNNESV